MPAAGSPCKSELFDAGACKPVGVCSWWAKFWAYGEQVAELQAGVTTEVKLGCFGRDEQASVARCCRDVLQVYRRCKLCQKHALDPKWHRSFRIGQFLRVVASFYHPSLAYAEGVLLKSFNSLSRLNCWSMQQRFARHQRAEIAQYVRPALGLPAGPGTAMAAARAGLGQVFRLAMAVQRGRAGPVGAQVFAVKRQYCG